MGDMAEGFRAMNEYKKEKRKSNAQWSTNYLIEQGIEFESKNGGAHLIVSHNDKIADFWPSTGKFQVRGSGRYLRGVKQLIKVMK